MKSNTINSARSAISFFLLGDSSIAEDASIKRLFRSFYLQRPQRAKYANYWPVSKLLELLKTWHPLKDLDIKRLTLKTISLIALSSSNRSQSLHLARTDKIRVAENCLDFVIDQRIKTTKRLLKPTYVKCVNTDIEELNVMLCVKEYMERTKVYRIDDSYNQLFLSFKSFKPVTKQSLARWLKETLKLAGINTELFTAHSYRGAGLSSAFSKGATLQQIVEAGNWASAETFKRFYNAPIKASDIGNLILEEVSRKLNKNKFLWANLLQDKATFEGELNKSARLTFVEADLLFSE